MAHGITIVPRNSLAGGEEFLPLEGCAAATVLPNLLQYPVALFGSLRAGMVVVNVNPLYTARELQRQLADSGAAEIVLLSSPMVGPATCW